MKKYLLVLLTFLSFTANAKGIAGFLIEPYLGYSSLNLAQESGIRNNSAGLNVASKGEGGGNFLTYGGRLGYSLTGLFLAFDYGAYSGEFEYDAAGSNNSDVDVTYMAGVVGYSFPMMLRVWAGMIFGADMTVTDTVSSTSADYSGSGFKFGVGFKLIPMLSLNLEYASVSYDEIKQSDGTTLTLPYTTSIAAAGGGGESYAEEVKTSHIIFTISLTI